MIAFAAMGELVTIFLLSGIEIRTVADGDIQDTILGFILLLSLILVATTGASLLRILQWWRPGLFKQMVAHDDPSEFGIRVGFAMMFFFIGLSILAHVEPFLGAFVAGAILSFVIRNKGALEHKLSSMAYGFFRSDLLHSRRDETRYIVGHAHTKYGRYSFVDHHHVRSEVPPGIVDDAERTQV